MSPDARVYGHIPNVPVFKAFSSREQLSKAGVHAPTQAGIHGDSSNGGGAFSICISRGYEDNKDEGERITYVGSGGQDSRGEQAADQSFDDPPNRSLQISYETRRPVRVIRGKNPSSYYAPGKGYRYDGLYVVESAELRTGKSGHKMCFFRLKRIIEEGSQPLPHRRTLTQKRMSNMVRQNRRR